MHMHTDANTRLFMSKFTPQTYTPAERENRSHAAKIAGVVNTLTDLNIF